MWLIAGLGNPGEEYEGTRHNIGFRVIDLLSEKSSINLRYKTKNYIYGKGLMEGKGIVLLKPLTFMNRSGVALSTAFRRFNDIDDILVIHDDLDLPLGVIRIKRGGSSGGHRGVESIIRSLGTGDFIRLRLGIGRSERLSPERYVLSPFLKSERSDVERMVEEATEAVSIILTKGMAIAQNRFHKRRKDSHPTL
jgi:PTH1 family peptidyl-tRNA hydrolase